MAEISKALSDVLDATNQTERRLEIFSSLQDALGHKEQLCDLLTAVHRKWRRLTEMFFTEEDEKVLNQLSLFLSAFGKTATVYGRFSGSDIDPLNYLCWVQQHICRSEIEVSHLRLLLEGLSGCLSGLEGTAYKSVAASLLSACCVLLNRPKTPISLFETIVDTMMLLCKAPGCIREQFTEVVDLVMGWASCAEAEWSSIRKVRSFLLQLKTEWELHMAEGMSWIDSVLSNLSNILDDGLSKMESLSVFRNMIACAAGIFEACSPFLDPNAIFNLHCSHLRCLIRGLKQLQSVKESDLSTNDFLQQISQLYSYLIVILGRFCGPDGIQAAMDDILLKELNEVQTMPEAAIGPISLLKTVIESSKTGLHNQALIRAFGNRSAVYSLRLSRCAQLVDQISQVYLALLTESTPEIQLRFADLFLKDLKNQVGRSLPGGHITTNQISTKERSSTLLDLKSQLFAFNLFAKAVDKKTNSDFCREVWTAAERSTGDHPLLISGSTRLMRKIWEKGDLPSRLHLSEIFCRLFSATDSKRDPQLGLLIVEWLAEVIRIEPTTINLSCGIEARLLTMLDQDASPDLIKALLSVLQDAIKAGLELQMPWAFINCLFLLATDLRSDVAKAAVDVLRQCGRHWLCMEGSKASFCSHERKYLDALLVSSQCRLRTAQLSTFLKKLTSKTTITSDTRPSTDWIMKLSQELILSSEITLSFQSLPQMAHWLVHESAKFLVATKFRSLDSGPSKLLRVLNDRLSELKQYLAQDRPVDRFHVWLLLEFVAGLQKHIFYGYDGGHFSVSPPESTWAYYLTNKTSFVEGFGRLLFKLLFVSHRCRFHGHAAIFGSAFVRSQMDEASKYLSEWQSLSTPKQTVLKVRRQSCEETSERFGQFLNQLVEGLQLLTLSLIAVGASWRISGIYSEMKTWSNEDLQLILKENDDRLFSWMQGSRLEADGSYEAASEVYRDKYDEIRKLMRQLQSESPTSVQSCLVDALHTTGLFILERVATCYCKVSNLDYFSDLETGPQEISKTMPVPLFKNQEAEMIIICDPADERLTDWRSHFLQTSSLLSPAELQTYIAASPDRKIDGSDADRVWRELMKEKNLLCVDESSRQTDFIKTVQLMSLADQKIPSQCLVPSHILSQLLFSDDHVHLIDSSWAQKAARLVGNSEEAATLSVLAARSETYHKNYNCAAMIMRGLGETIDSVSKPLQFALVSEKCFVSIQNCKDSQHSTLLLVHYWDVLVQNLMVVSGDQETVMAMSRWLVRFSEILLQFEKNNDANKTLAKMEIPDLNNLNQKMFLGQLQDTHSLTQVQKMRIFCVTTSLSLDQNWAPAWMHFSKMLLDGLRTADDLKVLLKNSVTSLCNWLKLSDDTEPLLNILILIKDHGSHFLDMESLRMLISVSPTKWKLITGQVFALLAHPCAVVRDSAVQILQCIAQSYPSTVLFPVLVEWKTEREDDEVVQPEIESLVEFFRSRSPGLIEETVSFIAELHKLDCLISEDWLSILSDAHTECQLRLSVLSEEVRRIRSEADEDQRLLQLRESYELIMKPLATSLRRTLERKKRESSRTEYERRFWTKFDSKLEDLISSLDSALADFRHKEIQKRWTAIKSVMKDVADYIKNGMPPLEDISPALASLKDTKIPMPGMCSAGVTIAGFSPGIEILSTKTRPKKLKLIGSDGIAYTFLLKGKEDLHIDEHLLEAIGVINGLMAKPGFRMTRVYSVTPLGHQIGLIQWLEDTASFYSLFRQWQTRQQSKLKELNESIAEPKPVPATIEHHPRDAFQRALSDALADAMLPRNTPRAEIPEDVLIAIFNKLKEEAPSDLLKNEIWCLSATEGSHWDKTEAFTKSVAVGNVVCYVLGIGDRHLDNMLLDLKTAEVVNIDFNLCFGSGTKLRIPEIVPFRLTKTLRVAMGPGGVQGVFRTCFSEGIARLRKHEEILLSFLESTLTDPVLDWTADRTKRSYHQNLELGLRLKLLMQKLDLSPLTSYQEVLERVRDSSRSFLTAFPAIRDLEARICSHQTQLESVDAQLRQAASLEGRLSVEVQSRTNLHSIAVERYRNILPTIDSILAVNRSWCYHYAQVFMALLDDSEDLWALSEHKWKSTCSNTILDFANSNSHMTIIGVVFKGNPPPALLQREFMEDCLAVDEQRVALDTEREQHFLKMHESLMKYSVVLKQLMSLDYISASHHFKWMMIFDEAKADPEATDVQSAKRSSTDHIRRMHRSLVEAYKGVEEIIKSVGLDSEEVAEKEKELMTKKARVQRTLSKWSEDLIKSMICLLCRRFLDEGMPEEGGSLKDWVTSVLGLGQMFRLIKRSLVYSNFLRDLCYSEGSYFAATGFDWLDSVERFVSQMTVLAENTKNGALVDVKCLMRSELKRVHFYAERFRTHKDQIQQLRRSAFQIYHRQRELEALLCRCKEQLAALQGKLDEVSSQLSLSQDPKQVEALAEEQLELTCMIHRERSSWTKGRDDQVQLESQTEHLMTQLEDVCQSFVGDLCGLARKSVKLETENDSIDLSLSSLTWGQMDFPLLHSLFKVFELYESWQNELREVPAGTNLDISSCRFPPSMANLDCWLDNIALAASLTESVAAGLPEKELVRIIELHFSKILEVEAKPLLNRFLTNLISSASPSDNGGLEDMASQDFEIVWDCLKSQGALAQMSLIKQSMLSWAGGDHPDQQKRLRHLAAFEWCHYDQVDSHDYLQLALADNQVFNGLPIPSKSSLIRDMKESLEALTEMQQAIETCDSAGEAVSMNLEQQISDLAQEDSAATQMVNVMDIVRNLVTTRNSWRAAASEHMIGMMHIVQTLLQFEFSTEGRTWEPGEGFESESFENFEVWLESLKEESRRLRLAETAMRECKKELQSANASVSVTRQKRDEFACQLRQLEDDQRETIEAIKRNARSFLSSNDSIRHHQTSLSGFLSHDLENWLRQLLECSGGCRNGEEINENASRVLEKIPRALSKIKDSSYSSHHVSDDLKQAILSATSDTVSTEILEVLDINGEEMEQTASTATQRADDVKDLITSVYLLVESVEEITQSLRESINVKTGSQKSQQQTGVNEDWVRTEGLSQEGFDFSTRLIEERNDGFEDRNWESLPEGSCSTRSVKERRERCDRPRLSRRLDEDQLKYSRSVIEDIQSRLHLKESIEEMTDQLISEATSESNLSKIFEGWMSWI